MYRYIVYRNNQMYRLEQHDKQTYNFESTSQIIELLFKYRNVLLYCDIFGAMHQYFQILYRLISNT